jgi:hypothetical protein
VYLTKQVYEKPSHYHNKQGTKLTESKVPLILLIECIVVVADLCCLSWGVSSAQTQCLQPDKNRVLPGRQSGIKNK